jgi:hypothetical protein
VNWLILITTNEFRRSFKALELDDSRTGSALRGGTVPVTIRALDHLLLHQLDGWVDPGSRGTM